MSPRDVSGRSPIRILVFAVLIIVETATVIAAIRIATGSWASATMAGAISGGLTAATYPALVRRRRGTTSEPAIPADGAVPPRADRVRLGPHRSDR
jgi:hypothetical protein